MSNITKSPKEQAKIALTKNCVWLNDYEKGEWEYMIKNCDDRIVHFMNYLAAGRADLLIQCRVWKDGNFTPSAPECFKWPFNEQPKLSELKDCLQMNIINLRNIIREIQASEKKPYASPKPNKRKKQKQNLDNAPNKITASLTPIPAVASTSKCTTQEKKKQNVPDNTSISPPIGTSTEPKAEASYQEFKEALSAIKSSKVKLLIESKAILAHETTANHPTTPLPTPRMHSSSVDNLTTPVVHQLPTNTPDQPTVPISHQQIPQSVNAKATVQTKVSKAVKSTNPWKSLARKAAKGRKNEMVDNKANNSSTDREGATTRSRSKSMSSSSESQSQEREIEGNRQAKATADEQSKDQPQANEIEIVPETDDEAEAERRNRIADENSWDALYSLPREPIDEGTSEEEEDSPIENSQVNPTLKLTPLDILGEFVYYSINTESLSPIEAKNIKKMQIQKATLEAIYESFKKAAIENNLEERRRLRTKLTKIVKYLKNVSLKNYGPKWLNNIMKYGIRKYFICTNKGCWYIHKGAADMHRHIHDIHGGFEAGFTKGGIGNHREILLLKTEAIDFSKTAKYTCEKQLDEMLEEDIAKDPK